MGGQRGRLVIRASSGLGIVLVGRTSRRARIDTNTCDTQFPAAFVQFVLFVVNKRRAGGKDE